MGFERIGGEEVWQGQIAGVRKERFRHDDGSETTREIVTHPGAVTVFAHDGSRFLMVSQPREPVGAQRLMELPAGKLDGEDELATAQRELAEETGRGARSWEHMTTFWASPGFSDERIAVYLATDLYDDPAESEEEERIEIHEVPLAELDSAIESCSDAKSLVGMLWFRAFHA